MCLREHIAFCQIRDARLTATISTVQKGSRALREKQLLVLHRLRLIYRRQAQTCRGAIAPIYWVPNEILGEIFTHCLPFNHRFIQTAAPLVLLQVCVMWRNITLSTGSFWSNVAFWSPPSDTDRSTCYPLRFLSRWLRRARKHSFDLFFEQGLVFSHLKRLVELVLLRYYRQCQHLDIHLARETAFALLDFVVLPSGSLMNLESLVLENLDEADFALEDGGAAITVFRKSPRLRKLTTNALDFTFRFDHATSIPEFDLLILPWAQLTHLMITDFIRVDILVVTLAECTNIQFLRISLDLEDNDEFVDIEQWLPQQPVVLSQLADLHLSLADGLSIPRLLDVFRFPVLQHLHFRRSESQNFDTSSSFSWASSRKFLLQLQTLRQLSLVGRVGTVEEILVLLQSAPLVTNLTLDIWAEYQVLIPIMFPPLDPLSPDPPRPLRQLTHLTFRLERNNFPFPSNRIRDAIESPPYRCFLTNLTIICQRAAYPRRMEEISYELGALPLQCSFGTGGGPITRSTRYRVDQHLIDVERTNRNYTMFDHLFVNPYRSLQ